MSLTEQAAKAKIVVYGTVIAHHPLPDEPTEYVRSQGTRDTHCPSHHGGLSGPIMYNDNISSGYRFSTILGIFFKLTNVNVDESITLI